MSSEVQHNICSGDPPRGEAFISQGEPAGTWTPDERKKVEKQSLCLVSRELAQRYGWLCQYK